MVIKDTREQAGWDFNPGPNCEGMVHGTLKTGDYSMVGMEHIFTIERKGSTGEFCQNLTQSRFKNELERLSTYKYAFIVLEFDMKDVMEFPNNSGIPKYKWKNVHVTNWFMLKCIVEYPIKYGVHIILAGEHGRDTAASIFKRVKEDYEKIEKAE